MDLWSSAETLMFMSLSMVLNRTVAPASRHTRAKLRSVGQALVRSLPDLPQAALCLPSVSKGCPTLASSFHHLQREAKTLQHQGAEELWANDKLGSSGRPHEHVAGTWTRMGTQMGLVSSTRLAQNHGLPKVVFGNGRRMELPVCHSPGSLFKQRGGRAPPLNTAQLGRAAKPQRSRL